MKGIRLYAYHGVLPQEQVVGAWYTLNIVADTDFSKSCQSDELQDTVSYAEIYEVVKMEMQIKSRLLEHLMGRIASRLFAVFPALTRISIEVFKENPPMGGEVAETGVSAVFVR